MVSKTKELNRSSLNLFKKTLPGMAIALFFLALILIFKVPTFLIAVGLIGFTAFTTKWPDNMTFKDWAKAWLKNATKSVLMLYAFIYSLRLTSSIFGGIIGMLVVFYAVGIYRVFKNRKQILDHFDKIFDTLKELKK